MPARHRGRRKPKFVNVFAYAIIVIFTFLTIDAVLYTSSIAVTYTPTAGSTGNVLIDKYDFIVHGVVFGNETGIITNTTIGSFATGVRVEAETYSDFHNIRAEIYNNGVLAHATTWNNVFVNTSVTVLTDYFTPGFDQGAEVRVRFAVEES